MPPPRPIKVAVSPKIHVAENELAALVYANGLAIADLTTDLIQRRNHVFTAISEPRIKHWNVSGKGIDNRQNAQLAVGEEFIMHEVRSPMAHPRYCSVQQPLSDLIGALLSPFDLVFWLTTACLQ